MRQNRIIVDLESRREGIAYPQPIDQKFVAFRNKLLEVLQENDLGTGWDYSPDDGLWFGTYKFTSYISGQRVDIHRHFHIDPKEPILEEIQRVIHERDALNHACSYLCENPFLIPPRSTKP